MSSDIGKVIEEKLKKEFNPLHLSVEDLSDGCGGKFMVVVVSEKFAGKSLLERHRLVNSCLEEEIKQIHAFSQKTYTPEQWEKQKSK
ncbi:protein BOLA2-like [Actinia tenebrosa]|uniref:Protein BOLA2-like n=1 Tax=Actinia tenebrosa TaxID=6105 RepID=A0A6P8HG30_ACTTE|nr:protein BOLA2-like [Actinia tenebrosa]